MMIQNCLKLLNEMSKIEFLIEEIERVLDENNLEPDPNLLKYLVNLKQAKDS